MKTILALLCVLVAACPVCGGEALDLWLASASHSQTGTITPTPWVPENPGTTVRSAPRVGYPTRGGHWTFPGHGRQMLIGHLLTDGIHRGRFTRDYLDGLTYQELLSLHDDHHEGHLKTSYVNASGTPQTKSEAREEKKAAKELGRQVFGTRDGKHPGPVGGWIRGSLGDPRYRSQSCPTGNCPWN